METLNQKKNTWLKGVLLGCAVLVMVLGATTQSNAELGNISTRAFVGTGDEIMIGGFIVVNGSVQVVIRAIGPSIPPSQVPNPLPDPNLTLRALDGTLISSNDNWVDSPDRAAIEGASFQGTSLAPSNANESAIILTLDPGAYTPQVSDAAGATGVALVEVFKVGGTGALGNISTRAFVATGDEILIGGFIVLDSQEQVVIRAIGPSLSASQVPNSLANPTLTLRALDGTFIASNDDWVDSPDSAAIEGASFQGESLAPSNVSESAIMRTLDPGAYTPQVSGVGGDMGVGLVEIFTVDSTTPPNGGDTPPPPPSEPSPPPPAPSPPNGGDTAPPPPSEPSPPPPAPSPPNGGDTPPPPPSQPSPPPPPPEP